MGQPAGVPCKESQIRGMGVTPDAQIKSLLPKGAEERFLNNWVLRAKLLFWTCLLGKGYYVYIESPLYQTTFFLRTVPVIIRNIIGCEMVSVGRPRLIARLVILLQVRQ